MKRFATLALLALLASPVLAQTTDEGTQVIIMAGQVVSDGLGDDGGTESLPAYLIQIQNTIGKSGRVKFNLLVNRNEGVNEGVYGDVLGGDVLYRFSTPLIDFGLGGGFGLVQTSGLDSDNFTAHPSAYTWQAVSTFDTYFSEKRDAGLRIRLARFDAIGSDIDGIQWTAGVVLPGIGN
jgi:hypothetical protein